MTLSTEHEKGIVKCVREQKLGEEVANAVSHGIGALLAIAGTVLLLIRAAGTGSALSVVSSALYGATLILLYTASTLYHALTKPGAKRVFQVFDHCSIYLLILGTYIPISLVTIGGALGWVLCGINLFCAVCGITCTAINLEKSHKASMVLYLIMGWLVIFAIKPVIAAIPARGLFYLVLGGVAYTGGIVFYKNKTMPYAHFIWHLFVMLGSVLQFFTVYGYCF